ncbi:hypothetical protein Bbelb_303030 [Branchiostoma belcheri]|nr:hypothetical protein Bbelb_303030 [Branchiostoma belcheri]
MAENMPSNTVPKAIVVRNEFFGEGMAKPDTGTVPSTVRQAAEGTSYHISGRCEGNKDNDDENLSDTSDAAAENSQTIDISTGDEFHTYAIAYICKEQTIRMTKAAVETKNKLKATKTARDNSNDDDIHLARRGSFNNDTETSTFKANDSNMHTQARDPNPMYTQNMNPQPMDAESDVNPNPMYLQSTTELIASPGPGSASIPNPMYTQNMNPQPTYSENDVNPNPMYLQSTMEPIASPGPARNPNPMYTPNATNPSPTHSRNDVNPNPMYLQSTMEPIASPGPARNPSPMYTPNATNPSPTHSRNDVNPNPMYLQSTMEPIASPGPARNPSPMYTPNATNPSPTHSRNDVNPNPMYLQSSPGPTFRSNKSENNPCIQTSADTHQQAFSRPATNNGSEDTQVSLSSQSQPAAVFNNINDANDVLHAVNPNPMYVPNVQHPAAHGGCTRRREIFAVEAAVVLGLFIVAGVFLSLFLSARPPQLPAVSNIPHHKGLSVLTVLYDMSIGPRALPQYPQVARPHVASNTIRAHSLTFTRHDGWKEAEKGPIYTEDLDSFVVAAISHKYLIVSRHGNSVKYNPSGVKIFEFGTYGRGEGQLNSPKGIYLDTSGHIIVANYLNHRVDMFTSQGEFVRTIASIKFPWAVAMGPCGELVVTGPFAYTVTIFPRHMVLP